MKKLKNAFSLLGPHARIAAGIAFACLLCGCGGNPRGLSDLLNSPLIARPTNLDFGDVPTGGSSTLAVILNNLGNASVTISQVNVSGTGFSISGLSLPLTLTAGQSATFSVKFAPQATGSATGSVSVVSNAPNSPTVVSLAGNGVHSVSLTWDASTSVVAGYNVYRGNTSGGPYTRIGPSVIAATTYTDTGVLGGQTHFYVVTAVDANNVESVFSNEAQAVVPLP